MRWKIKGYIKGENKYEEEIKRICMFEEENMLKKNNGSNEC